MTLPRGFGKGWDEPKESKPSKKCKLGKLCDSDYPHYQRCSIHDWTWTHDEAYLALRIMGVIILIIGGLGLGVSISHETGEPIRQNIERFNCNQLAEYIADRQTQYGYAEHRYEWLCVNEKIKEFQG